MYTKTVDNSVHVKTRSAFVWNTYGDSKVVQNELPEYQNFLPYKVALLKTPADRSIAVTVASCVG